MVPLAGLDRFVVRARNHQSIARAFVMLATVAATSCGSETEIMFTVTSGTSIAGQRLRLIAITEAGRVPGAVVLPEDNRALVFPGTLAVKVPNKDSLVGILLQLENNNDQVVARARTAGCVTSASTERQLQVELQASFTSWDNDFVMRCSCAAPDAKNEMCPLPIIAADAGAPSDGAMNPMPQPMPQPMPNDAATLPPPPPVDAGAVDVPDGATMPPVTASALFGFEDAQAWTSADLMLSRDTMMRSQGEASLAFAGTGRSTTITSRPFRTDELGTPTSTLKLDLFVAQAQDFSGSLQIVLHCPKANIFEQYLTWHALHPLPAAKWTTLSFALTADTVRQLQQPADGCQLRIAHQGTGLFRLDNLTFAR